MGDVKRALQLAAAPLGLTIENGVVLLDTGMQPPWAAVFHPMNQGRKRANGRIVYEQQDGKAWVFHSKEGHWCVSEKPPASENPTGDGGWRVRSNAMSAEQITDEEVWSCVDDKGDWQSR